MIKLLMGITLSETGGSQRVVFDIISNLPENLYDITLVTAPGGELLDWINILNQSRKSKIKVCEWACLKRDISPFNDMVALFKMLRLLKREKYAIVHLHNSKMGIIGRIAAKIARTPKVYYTVHGWGLNKDTTGWLYKIVGMMERIVSHFCTEIIFVSQNDMERGIRNRWASHENSCLIYNGVAEEPDPTATSLPEIPDHLPVIAFVARLAEPKDPLFALRVSERLYHGGQDHLMLIIGNGPMYAECIQLIDQLQLGKHVAMMGKRDDVRALLKRADIFCLFSKWEGLPITILEAMSSGLPVVASNVGGVSEMIVPGKTGYLIDDFQVDEAAGFLRKLIEDKEARRNMGLAARETACEKFSLNNMVDRYRQLYEKNEGRNRRVS